MIVAQAMTSRPFACLRDDADAIGRNGDGVEDTIVLQLALDGLIELGGHAAKLSPNAIKGSEPLIRPDQGL